MTSHTTPPKPIGQIADPVERRTEAALRAAQIGVFEFEPQADRAFWDARVRALWGVEDDTEVMTYDKIVAQVHPEDRGLHDAGSARAFDPAGDGKMDMTYRLYPRGGKKMRWIRARGEVHFEDGVAQRLVGTVEDVTEIQEAQARNDVLLHELEHRVKNTLATAIAVVNLSRGFIGDAEDRFDAVTERMRSLAAAHDTLFRSHWAAVPFERLLLRVKSVFLAEDDARIAFSGDPAEIAPKHVMTFSMALHELITNALKHGALRGPDGHITVTAQVDDTRLWLTWTEHGGPQDRSLPDADGGFGMLLLRSILPAEVGGATTLDMTPDGLKFSLSMPSNRG